MNDIEVRLYENDDGSLYTRLTEYGCFAYSGKIFFIDRKFKTAAPGLAMVHITNEKENYGFVDGEMIDLDTILPTPEQIKNYIAKIVESGYGNNWVDVHEMDGRKIVSINDLAIFLDKNGEPYQKMIPSYYMANYVDRYVSDDIIKGVGKPATIEEIIASNENNAMNQYSIGISDGMHYLIGDQLSARTFYTVGSKTFEVLENKFDKSKLHDIKPYYQIALEHNPDSVIDAEELVKRVNEAYIPNIETRLWEHGSIPSMNKNMHLFNLLCDAQDMGILDFVTIHDNPNVTALMYCNSNLDLFSQFSTSEVEEITNYALKFNKEARDKIKSLIKRHILPSDFLIKKEKSFF